jgi:glycerol dehydrogenase
MAIFHVFVSPKRYVQGPGALAEAGTLIYPLGRTAFVLHSSAAADSWIRSLAPTLSAVGIDAHSTLFAGEHTRQEIERVTLAARIQRTDLVIGLGDRTALDVAKGVARNLQVPLVIIPTVTTSAAATRTPAMNDVEAGALDPYHAPYSSPDLVLVDTQVIADGPARAFVAGIGEALPTWFAARATAQSYATTMAGGWQTTAASAVANGCWETLRCYAPEAVAAVRAHRVTDAVERVVEATTLLSGLGAENGGLAAAHAIRNGLATRPEMQACWHGELMAFALLTQLELERRTENDRRDVLRLCLAVGLPVCFVDLGVQSATAAHIAHVAARALSAGESIDHEPCTVTQETVMEALRAADARGFAARGSSLLAASAPPSAPVPA